jgi:hypothetical protein
MDLKNLKIIISTKRTKVLTEAKMWFVENNMILFYVMFTTMDLALKNLKD